MSGSSSLNLSNREEAGNNFKLRRYRNFFPDVGASCARPSGVSGNVARCCRRTKTEFNGIGGLRTHIGFESVPPSGTSLSKLRPECPRTGAAFLPGGITGHFFWRSQS